MPTRLRPTGQTESDLAKRLKAAVKAAGGNQRVAQASGVPLGSINNYVGGRNTPSADAILKIAYACRVNVEWLVRGEGRMALYQPGDTTHEGGLIVEGPFMPIEPAPSSAPAGPPKLLGYAHAKRLGMAVAMAAKSMLDAGTDPDPTVIGELTIRIYDVLNADIDPPTAIVQITTMLIDARQEANRRLRENAPTTGTPT